MVWLRRLAAAAAIATGALLLLSVGLAILAPSATSIANLLLGLAVAPLAAGLGVVITRRSGATVVGALLTSVALTVSLTVAREVAAPFLAARPGLAASLSWLVAIFAEVAWWVLVAVALLLLFFPDGHLPGRRWRWVPAAAVVAAFVTQAYGAFDVAPFRPPLEDLARPFGPAPLWLEVLAFAAFVLLLAIVLASAFSLVLRYRRSDRLRRAKIKWLAIGGLGVALYPFVCGLEILAWGSPGWVSAAVGISGLVGIPVGISVATLRYDLYDVDKALSRTVAWGLVTVTLVGVYAASLFTAGVLLGRESATAAAAATALAALTLSPLRHRLQQAIDRRLYPQRGSVLAALDGLYRDAGAGRAQPEELQSVLRTALRDEQLLVGFRMPGAEGYVDPRGEAMLVHDRAMPVMLSGEPIGVLVPGSGGPSHELLREVAGRATTMIEVVRLRLELAQALREVEASRARLVQIGYVERRRLERDLHDGAQQRLVSLGMALRVAQRHIADGTVDLHGLLDESVAELGTAVAELRQIAHGLRPTSLDDGLQAAVGRLVQSVPVTVEMEFEAGSLPDDVATTAYFVISEAVTNAVKHANASCIGLRVSRTDGKVVVQVRDDGKGGAVLHERSALADRVAALGGSLAVDSPAGRGTIVEATLPCG
jgi:signal transduction histidine kinase